MEYNLKKTFECELCSIAFSQEGSLKIHKRTHTGEKPYKCELCSKAFNRKDHLDVHKRIHTGEKRYKCELCSKAFNQKSIFNFHKRNHTSEEPYKYELYSQNAFNHKSHLNDHKQIHTDEKPLKCGLCSKTFAQKSDFIKHRKTHTDEKPYKCELCSIVFTHKMTQTRHERIHSGKRTHILSFSTSSKKEILKEQPLSEDASISTQEFSTQGGKIKHENKTVHLINIQSVCSLLLDYRKKHMLTPEEVFKDIKLWQVEDGVMANRSMHPLKNEDYPHFLRICNNDIRESDAKISSNLLDSHLWITIQCFLSYIYKNSSSATSIDNCQANLAYKTWINLERIRSVNNSYLKTDKRANSKKTLKDLSNPRVDSKVQENSCDVATNATGRIVFENKGEEIVAETSSTNGDALSIGCHLVITNVRSLEDFPADSQSSCVTEEEKGNLNVHSIEGYIESYDTLGAQLEESQPLTEKKEESHESSVNKSFVEKVEAFFFKAEVISSDEEDNHD